MPRTRPLRIQTTTRVDQVCVSHLKATSMRLLGHDYLLAFLHIDSQGFLNQDMCARPQLRHRRVGT